MQLLFPLLDTIFLQAAALDLIGEIPIGRASVVTTYQIQVFCDLPGKMVDVASDNIASKSLHAPMSGKKNPKPEVPMAS
jgi:hypothetical protein